MHKIAFKLTYSPFTRSIPLVFLLSLLLSGCTDDPDSDPAPNKVVEPGSWVTYSPIKWTHDGEPFHSSYCIVYSDGASFEMKRDVGAFADEKFSEILDLLNNFYDIRNGWSFPDAFEKNFGISITDFEAEYYDRMRAYLGGGS